jgi:inner membrane protein involved in colicin E2 resistance
MLINSFELRPGQKVGCVLYDGNSKVVATMVYSYLNGDKEKNEPIKLGNTNLLMRVTDIEPIETVDPLIGD